MPGSWCRVQGAGFRVDEPLHHLRTWTLCITQPRVAKLFRFTAEVPPRLMPKAREQSANCGQGVGVRLPLSSEVSIHKTVEVRVGHGWRGALVLVTVDVPLHHLRAEGRYKAIWKMGIQSSLAQGQSTKVMLMIKWIRTSRLWLSIKSSLSL